MSIAKSDALSSIHIGMFTGSVRAMTESTDFLLSFKKMFKLKHLGLWWDYSRSELAWTKDSKKWTMHYELDQTDVNVGKNEDILSYFNKSSLLVDNNFFGTQMSISPIFAPFLEDEVKMKITKHAKKQAVIGSNLKSITLSGTHILNWADGKMESTLHRELMMVESIFDKKK